MDTLRLQLNKILGKETVLDLDLLGTPVRLVVEARREIRRARAISEEASFVRRMWDYLSDGDVVYDIGANIGLLSLLLAQHARGKGSRVHCFEPEPRNFAQLQRNISQNGLGGRVVAHQLALAEREGDLELFVRGGPGEGRHSTVASKGSTGSIRVRAETVAAFAESSGTLPDLVKIDVEGAEGRVLAGMASLLRAGAPREIFMELHDKGDGDLMPEGTPIGQWLPEHGYELLWEFQRGRTRHCHYRRRGAAKI